MALAGSATGTTKPGQKPDGLTATPGDTQVTLTWKASDRALSYNVYRGTASNGQADTPVATGITTLTYVDKGLTNGTGYYYKVRALAATGLSEPSSQAAAKPQPPPPKSAPTDLTAIAGNARVVLTWTAVTGATGYRIFRGTAAGGESAKAVSSTTKTTDTDKELENGTTYFYKIAAFNGGGQGPLSREFMAIPIAPPDAPAGISATSGNGQVTLNWTPVARATSYNVYRGTSPNHQTATPVAAGVPSPPYLNSGLTNGTVYYYKVAAVNAGGEGPRSDEVSANPEGPPPDRDPAVISAFVLLRHATWGPKPGDADHVKSIGAAAFLDEQFAEPGSTYPDALFNKSVEEVQERFMQLALSSPDQLRLRVAWALHKIWVVSAVEVNSAPAIVTYHRTLLNGAFGNYRDLMRDVTLNSAMGRYLNMLNNRSQAVTGEPPNENYAREVMQLFTVGIPTLNPDGTPALDAAGRQIPVYTEADVKELARIFTGWTFGNGNPAANLKNLGKENYKVPMQPVERFHDSGAKEFLGVNFPPGQTARQDLDHALDVLFNHPNLGPFISRQLIQQLVTSNPSPAYVRSIVAVFNDNGRGVRGDLPAVVRAILMHPEAATQTISSGKLTEPALFVVSLLRGMDAAVTDHPFMSDKSEAMGQKVFYPGSVFSYFSPGYRIRGTTLNGPEFQILTSVTALERVNFVGDLLGGSFGKDVKIDYKPFITVANDPAALADYCSQLFMGGQMSAGERNEIINAVRVTPANKAQERVRTALYLTLTAAQFQVDR